MDEGARLTPAPQEKSTSKEKQEKHTTGKNYNTRNGKGSVCRWW